MTTLRVISNMRRLKTTEVAGVRVQVDLWPIKERWWTTLVMFGRSFRYDYVLLNAVPRSLFQFALFQTLFPFSRCRLVALDILLSRPRNRREGVKTLVRSILLRRVHRILLYYRDTSGIQRHLRLPASKFGYIPFKINEFDLVMSTCVADRGYVFCGGKTRRDFRTFFEAVEPLGIPLKVVTTSNDDIARHGSFLEEAGRPPHVEVIRLDGSSRPFVELMAGARVVVLPLKPDIGGVGIGVYLMAMALGKCVVISEGPSTTDLLSSELALVVPPEDPEALRAAVLRAFTDETLRRRLGQNGREYALSLGSEKQLLERVIQWLWQDFEAARAGPDR